jgi:hypothetical protein
MTLTKKIRIELQQQPQTPAVSLWIGAQHGMQRTVYVLSEKHPLISDHSRKHQ